MRSLFCCLRFEGTDKTKRLTTIIHQSQRDISEHRGLTEASIDQRLLPKKVRNQIINESDEVNINRFEWFLYLQIPDRLNGQLLLTDVIKYRSLDADLVAKGTWKVEQKQLLENTQQPKLLANPKHYIPEIVDELHVRMQAVGNYLNQSDNKGVILRQKGKGYHWRLPTANKKHTVNNPFFQQMRKIDLIDVLRVVDQDTGFIDEFKHVLGMSSKSRLYETDLLAILIANGTNQGIYGMAQISDRSYNQLSRIQANYFRLETLNSANDKINNATINLPIFKHYNIKQDSVHASIDGQKFESRRETFRTRYSSKYFGTGKGVSSVSLNINHLVPEAKIIGSNDHESHYIYDLLKNNSTELDPDTVSTDTHGANHVNFALLDLFGYRFAPRYAKVGKVINGLLNITEDQNGDIQLTLKKPIKTNIIVKHWDTIQRIAVSLDQCKTTQATLVRKLSGYKSNHPLLEALTEYNRLLKALYLLRYIDDEDLRNHVQRALNRGEAYHQLRRAISSVNGDKFRGNSDEEIQIWNECARLLANAIIYFNSKVLSHLLTSFEQQGKSRQLAIIKNASPVAWENINFRGTYKFSEVDELPILEELMATIEGYEPTEFE